MPDSNAGRPAWQRSKPMEVRRAIDPETNRPFPRLSFTQRTKLAMIKKFSDWFIKGWLARQVLKYITIAGTAIGATADQTTQTAAFLTAAAAALVELVCSWLSRKWLKKQPGVTE